MLIPIRLELEIEYEIVKDIFLWDTEEKTITPKYFSEIYVEENNIINPLFEELIAANINKQIRHYTKNVIKPFMKIRKQLREGKSKLFEMLEIITIDIQIKDNIYKDKFIWDIFNIKELQKVENFASSLMKDSKLPKTFLPAITYEIAYQVLLKMESIVTKGVYYYEKNAQTIRDTSKNSRKIGPNNTIIRSPMDRSKWHPVLSKLSAMEFKKKNSTSEREQRISRRRNASVIIQPSLMSEK